MKSNERMHGRVTIISYDLLTRSAKSFGSGGQGSSPTAQFGVIIVDESHFLKSAKALRTKVIGPLVKRTKIAVLLSGTPALSRPAELYTQVSNLCPRLLPSWNDYAKRYCDAKQGRFGLESGGASNLEELRALLRSVMIRRLKAEVLTELPAKRRQQVFLDLPAAAVKDIRKKLHECSKLKCIVDNPSYPEAERKQAHTTSQQMLNELYMESGAAKIPHVNEYIKMLVEGGCKFLVFAHHKQVMDGICKELGEQKPPVHYIRIDGDTPMSERQRLVQAYQNDARMQVAVLSITAAGVGLTLTAANAVVFAELSWVPGNIIQAEDRAHRIGQQFSVNIHFLLAKDTIDDLMWPCIDKKLNVVANTLDGRLAQNFGDKQTHVPSVDISQPSIRAFLSQSPAGTWCEGGEGAGSAGYHAGGREGVGEERSTMCGRGSSVDAKMGQKSEGLPKGNTLGADHCLDQSRSKGDYAIHAGGRKRQRVFEGDSDDE
jgi:SWI/SNF-related matrix-associated actin-dependent regulator 1 of chromatin subfamily A